MSAPEARASDGFRNVGIVLGIVFLLLFWLAWLWLRDYQDRSVPRDLQQQVPRTSPFLEQRYQSALTADMATPLAISGVLGSTGHSDHSVLLRSAVQRSALKALLDEPYQPAATIDAAIRQEASESESIDALRGRVRAKVVFERVPRGDGEPSITQDKEGRSAVHVSLQVTNHLVRPVTPVLRFDPDSGAYSHLRCINAAGGPVPARGTVRALCSSSYGPTRDANATAHVLSRDAFKPIALRLELGDVVVTEHFTLPSGPIEDHGERARLEVSAADCHALSACDEIARRKLADFRKRVPQRLFLIVSILYAGLLWLGLSRMPPSPVRDRSRLITLLACAGLALVPVSTFLTYGAADRELGLAFYFSGLLGVLVIILGLEVLTASVLGALVLWSRTQRTRVRLFALGLAAAAPVLTAFALS